MDVVFVGAGPAGLAGAIELANLVRRDNEGGGGLGDVEIAVLEKAAGLGEHTLSAPSSTLGRSARCSPAWRMTRSRSARRSRPSACTSCVRAARRRSRRLRP
jgi:flavin-dependent dehydrogenase